MDKKPETDSAKGLLRALYSTQGELYSASLAGLLLLLGWGLNALFDWPRAELAIWASLGLGLIHGVRAAWESLAEKKVDIDVLMVVGAIAAASIGHAEEGALLLFLFVLAGALEDLAMARTKREIEALHKLMPTEATVLREGEWVDAAPESLVAGERVKIKPGQRAPADCRLVQGATEMDQSAITGESMPRAVKVGDELFAGTINLDDPVEAEVTRPAKESSLQKVLNLVTTAREQREPVQRTIDRMSGPYSVGVMGLSLAVVLIWWLALGRTFDESLYTAITLLIVGSPCALIIATPTATLSAIARGARAGVLFKGGQAIERLSNIGAVCFDKTGTLTMGRPRLDQVHAVAWSEGKRLLSLAAAIEGESTHPIAAALRDAAKAREIAPDTELSAITHTTGRGMSAVWRGAEVRLGSTAHTDPVTPVCLRQRVHDVLKTIRERGQMGVVIAVGVDEEAVKSGRASDPAAEGVGEAAVLIMSDSVRPGARALVKDLHALGVKPVKMLTGDNRTTAERVATSLGIDEFAADLLPQDKLDAVAALKEDLKYRAQTKGGPVRGVAVIGDGVNDAPALAAADVSMAIGSIGSDAALESADIVLLADDLSAVPWAVKLARRARSTVRANLTFALGIIAVMGVATLVMSLLRRPVALGLGVVAHEGGTLLVVLNSLRLLWVDSPRQAVSRGAGRESVVDGRGRERPAEIAAGS
ncbi:MAG: cation-translocating P-type ATPase [Phycisphaeraceae bacterium]|nr:cation-translocating P-type ATPase [Phycisphaeraceae bacterium]